MCDIFHPAAFIPYVGLVSVSGVCVLCKFLGGGATSLLSSVYPVFGGFWFGLHNTFSIHYQFFSTCLLRRTVQNRFLAYG